MASKKQNPSRWSPPPPLSQLEDNSSAAPPASRRSRNRRRRRTNDSDSDSKDSERDSSSEQQPQRNKNDDARASLSRSAAVSSSSSSAAEQSRVAALEARVAQLEQQLAEANARNANNDALCRAAVEAAHVLELVPTRTYDAPLYANRPRERITVSECYLDTQRTPQDDEHDVNAFIAIFDSRIRSAHRCAFYDDMYQRGHELATQLWLKRAMVKDRTLRASQPVPPVPDFYPTDEDPYFAPLMRAVQDAFADDQPRADALIEMVRKCMREVADETLRFVDELSTICKVQKTYDARLRMPSGEALDQWTIAPLIYNVHVRSSSTRSDPDDHLD